jgi:uncharacterized membrane protein
VNITFIVPFAGYNEGESASFHAERAEAMLKKKVAVPYEGPLAEEAQTAKKAKKAKDEPCPEAESQPANQF